MKSFIKTSLLTLSISALFATTASAGWVTEDGTAYTADCCRSAVVVHKAKPAPAPKACLTCDYSRFPMAQTMPVEAGERLQPAKLGNCGMKK